MKTIKSEIHAIDNILTERYLYKINVKREVELKAYLTFDPYSNLTTNIWVVMFKNVLSA